MIHKYTDNIAYLFKKDDTDNDLVFEVTGKIFQYNKVMRKRRLQDMMTGQFVMSTEEVYRTDWQLGFKTGDKISFTKIPTEDDSTIIDSVIDTPIMQEGNKHRKQEYYDYDLTLV
jgi:hypothetical protein